MGTFSVAAGNLMYQKIIIAVDLNDESLDVINEGVEIALFNKADYLLVHVLESPVTGYGELSGGKLNINAVQLKQTAFPVFKQLAAKAGVSPCKLSVEVGHVVESLLEKAEHEDADLIVIGSHGNNGIKAVLGSTCNGVLQEANMNVLAVRVNYM